MQSLNRSATSAACALAPLSVKLGHGQPAEDRLVCIAAQEHSYTSRDRLGIRMQRNVCSVDAEGNATTRCTHRERVFAQASADGRARCPLDHTSPLVLIPAPDADLTSVADFKDEVTP